jgi:hypothetical protein
MALGAPLSLGSLNVIFEGSATISGEFPLSNAPGGTIAINRTMTVPGSLTVGGTLVIGSAGYIVTISGTLTLEATGVITNPGTLRVGAFVNLGGTVIGNPPQIVGLGAGIGPLRIDTIRGASAGLDWLLPPVLGSAGTEVIIRWRANAGEVIRLEASRDLRIWTAVSAPVSEVEPGVFECHFGLPTQEPFRCFRLRREVADR